VGVDASEAHKMDFSEDSRSRIWFRMQEMFFQFSEYFFASSGASITNRFFAFDSSAAWGTSWEKALRGFGEF